MTILFDRRFWIGLACGIAIGAGLIWRFDRRAVPSAELQDGRRAALAGKWELVRGVLGRYLKRFPEDPEARILFARSLAAMGDYTGCLQQLARITDQSQWSGEARLREAQAHLMSNFGARAERGFLRSIELVHAGLGNQQFIDSARLGLIQLYGLEVRYDEAREQLRQALKTTQYPAAILSLFLQIHALGTEPNQAIVSLRHFVQNDADDFEARRALGHHYVVIGQIAEARPILEDCLREQPKNLRVAEALAQCQIDAPDLEACRRVLDSVESEAQHKPWYWRQRGYLREQELDWEGAAQCYERAVKLAPHEPAIHHMLAAVLTRLQRAERAAAMFERETALRTAQQMLPDLYARLIATGVQAGGPGPDAELCYLIGSSSQILGLEEAEDWFREALARDPTHSPSRSALEQLRQLHSAGSRASRTNDAGEP